MAIEYHILGAAGRDNGVLVYVHTGQAVVRLLFDCGEGTLAGVPFAEIQRIDHLLFSHLHMDHISGFDAFFRCTYIRTSRPNVIWGPAETARILHHRFQGFLWNLHEGREATWRVCDVLPDAVACMRFELAEAFAHAYPEATRPFDGVVLETPNFRIEALHLEHLTPVLGYIVRESPRQNVNPVRLRELGLQPGPWLQQLKRPEPGQTTVEAGGTTYAIAELRETMLIAGPGDTLAYLTDFLPDDAALARLIPALRGCKVIICESAYRDADAELARQNTHLTTTQAARLALEAGVGKLVLIHLSDRYPREEWPAMLAEAQAIFPRTELPKGWG